MLIFNDYLNTNPEDCQFIFSFYLSFLGELSSKNFPYEKQLQLVGAGLKFTNTISKISYVKSETIESYSSTIHQFQEDLKHYRRIENRSVIYNIMSLSNKKRRFAAIQDSFQDLYSKTIELLNEATDKTVRFDSLKINDFYKPDNSNKNKIKELILEAIGIIEVDDSLTEETKKSIIDYLNTAISELERERVNWSRFLGRIKETVIVLGALGSLVGGVSTLINAQEKLEQTTIIIQKTSANLNYNVLNQTFNIHNIQHIESLTQLLELPENTHQENNNKTDSNTELSTTVPMDYSPKTAIR